MSEIVWRKVVGFDGYEISEFGDLRSYRDNSGKIRGNVVRVIKPYISKHGYKRATITHGHGHTTTKFIHTIVAEAFIGERPTGMQVCHCDCDKNNNHFSNLRYDTAENNMLDSIVHNKTVRGSAVNTAKLLEEDVRVIRKIYQSGRYISLKHLAYMFNVSLNAIKNIVYQTSWKHIL